MPSAAPPPNDEDAAGSSIPAITVVATAWEHADSELLRAAQRVEIAERYGTPDSEPGPAPTGADITIFFVAYSAAGVPLGCGGLRTLDARSGEIKQMYVAPEARGTGVSVAVIRTLENTARGYGWSDLLLETGTAQPDALRFYQREGYSRVANFGYYAGLAGSLCFGKRL